MKIKLDFLKQKEKFLKGLLEIVFRVSALGFVVLFIIEYIIPGFVTSWFNPIWLLIIAIISGIIVTTKE